jgi:aminoglycoside phosphotransferase (APT) family kinase protein
MGVSSIVSPGSAGQHGDDAQEDGVSRGRPRGRPAGRPRELPTERPTEVPAERSRELPAERLVERLAALVEGAPGGVRVLKQTRVVVIRVGDVVVKAHAPGTDRAALAARLAAADRIGDVLMRPLSTEPREEGGRLVTMWPAGQPVDSVDPLDPFAAPWYEGGRLLARLHAVPPAALDAPPAGTPPVDESPVDKVPVDAPSVDKSPVDESSVDKVPMDAPPVDKVPVDAPPVDKMPVDKVCGGALPVAGGPGRVVEAVRALAGAGMDGPEIRVIGEAFEALPPLGGGRRGVAHGDWHLGQMARLGGRWTLIDVDDLGIGDPAWDLARPAAFFAAGVLAPEVWARFLAGYHEAGGWAVSAVDPWRELDGPARALTVQLAAQAVVRARDQARPLGEAEEAMVGSCARIAAMARRRTP